MEITRDNTLRLLGDYLKRSGASVNGLEREAGVPKDTLRDFLRGKTQILRADKLQKILAVIAPPDRVRVQGYVGEEALIAWLEEDAPPLHAPCPPGLDASDVVALHVRSDAMAPVVFPGALLYYTLSPGNAPPAIPGGWQVPYALSENAADRLAPDRLAPDRLAPFLGKPCVLHLSDGRWMFRTLKANPADGYDLISYQAGTLTGVAVAEAYKILFIRPA